MISYRESQLIKFVDTKPTEIDSDGTKKWKNKEGRYHRENDKPAIEFSDGGKVWYINGKRHRENDKPAVEYADGRKIWYINGLLNRENDKPAIEWNDGGKIWYINGKFIKRNYDSNDIIHNDKFFDNYGNEIKTTTAQLRKIIENLNKPTEIKSDGTKKWRNKEGKYHRLNDKPAVEYPNGGKEWWINGKLHRENDKPAVEWNDGGKIWYVNDKFIKRNWDKNGIIHNNKFFNDYGNEI